MSLGCRDLLFSLNDSFPYVLKKKPEIRFLEPVLTAESFLSCQQQSSKLLPTERQKKSFIVL